MIPRIYLNSAMNIVNPNSKTHNSTSILSSIEKTAAHKPGDILIKQGATSSAFSKASGALPHIFRKMCLRDQVNWKNKVRPNRFPSQKHNLHFLRTCHRHQYRSRQRMRCDHLPCFCLFHDYGLCRNYRWLLRDHQPCLGPAP